ncbi:MAG: type IX secretion system protein PorQ [Bacteroidales bacterium]|nr:type IX secretion system protein PorQ [Bacteroidales bacterium]MBN2820316.1 type IX secretion system protein PorQ [Bacteroidales bacterium]
MFSQGKSIAYIICIFLLGFSVLLKGQSSGGDNAYDFLNVTNSARVASLGGQQISLCDDDLNLVFHNPSLLTPQMDNNMVLNYVNYFAGVNYGYAAYAWKPQKPYTLAAGIHYVYYGEFTETNASADITGTFRAADYALNLFYSRPVLDSLLNFGVNIKPVYSDLESYMSFGMAFDAGLTYHNPDKLFTAALVVKNTGLQIVKYYADQERENLPFELQMAITQELKHAPFRFSILGQQLQRPNLSYMSDIDLEKSIDPLTGEVREQDPLAGFADNFMRHIIFGMEFIPTKNFNVRVGYNYKRRQEMKLSDAPGTVGFSWGFGLKVSKFHISYGRASYHAARGSNHFSVAMNLSEFTTRL